MFCEFERKLPTGLLLFGQNMPISRADASQSCAAHSFVIQPSVKQVEAAESFAMNRRKFKLISGVFTWICSHHFANFHFFFFWRKRPVAGSGAQVEMEPFLEGKKKGINSLVIVITAPFVARFQFWRQRISGFRPLTTVFCFTCMAWPFDRQNGNVSWFHFWHLFHEMPIGDVAKMRNAWRNALTGFRSGQSKALSGYVTRTFNEIRLKSNVSLFISKVEIESRGQEKKKMAHQENLLCKFHSFSNEFSSLNLKKNDWQEFVPGKLTFVYIAQLPRTMLPFTCAYSVTWRYAARGAAFHFRRVLLSGKKKEMQRNRLIRSLCMFRVLFVPAVSLQMSRERQRSRCGDLSDTWRHLSAVFFRRISGSLEICCFAGITSTGGVLTGFSLVPGHFLKILFRQFF